MECVGASGARGSCRRQPETTRKVFSWTRSCEPATQKKKLAQSLNTWFQAREAIDSTNATSPMKKRLSPKTFAGLLLIDDISSKTNADTRRKIT